MKNFSEANLISNKEQVISKACSLTGLQDSVIHKIYESQKFNGKLDNDIDNYFENISNINNFISSEDFIRELSDVLTNLSLTDDKTKETNYFPKKLLDILNNFTESKQIDTVNLLNIVNELLILKDSKAKNKLIPLIELNFDDNKVLNESFNNFLPNDNIQNTQYLFEGLKQILTKNNKRWGISYHIDNSYNAIMNYLEEEVSNIQLNNKIQSISDDFHVILLNEFLSGNVNPLYKHISSCKQLIPDLQTVVFDMVLLINSYIQTKDSTLQYVSLQNFNEYKNSGETVMQNIISSIPNSKILSEDIKKNFLKTPEKPNYVEGEIYAEGGYFYGKNVLHQLTNSINYNCLSNYNYNLNIKSVVDMANFIKSTSTEFNLKIRPYIRQYITKTYELLSMVENTENLRARIGKQQF